MPSLSEIDEHVRPYIANCPEFIVEREALLATRNFCQASRAWVSDTSTELLAGENSLQMPTGASDELIDITILLDGVPINNVFSRSNIYTPLPVGRPTAFAVYNERVYFSHASDQTYTVRFSVTIKPGVSATQVDTDLYNRWMEAIQYHTIYRILIQPAQQWTDPQTGKEFEFLYLKELTRAKASVRSGYSSGAIAAQQRPFA